MDAWKKESRLHRCTLVTLFLGGTGLRLAFLFQPMVHDEAVTYVYFASRPLSVGLSYYPYPNNHLFHTLLAHISTGIFGSAPCAVRLPAFLAGILVIPATYLVARKLLDKNTAILATAITAVSLKLVFYSTCARGYSIQTLLFLLMILAALGLMREDKLRLWALLTVLGALCFYTVPTSLYPVGALLAWMLASALLKDVGMPGWDFIKKLVLSCVVMAAVTALLYLPVFLKSGIGVLNLNGLAEPLDWAPFLKGLLTSMGNLWKNIAGDIPLVLMALLTMGFILALLFYHRIAKKRANFPLVILAWCALLLFLQRVVPFTRVWIPFYPLFYGFSVAGLYFGVQYLLGRFRPEDKRRELKPALFDTLALVTMVCIGILLIVSQSPYQPSDQVTFPDAEKVALFLKENLKAGDEVYMEPRVRQNLEYYFLRSGIPTSYLYGFEGNKPGLDSVKRAIVVEVRQRRHTSQMALEYGNLGNRKNYHFDVLKRFPSSTVYVIRNLKTAGGQSTRSHQPYPGNGMEGSLHGRIEYVWGA